MNNMPQNRKISKIPFFAAFSVGAVLFSAHAGGGFATGNQANTYYVGLGWSGIIAAVIAMLLLTLTMRQAMVMYNSRGLTSYKELFQTLYHPFDKLEWVFEIFFYIMVLMAVAAAISGAASALQSYFGLNYYIGVGIVGVIVLMLTIFGAGIVRAASTWMGIAILVTAISIYAIGIFKSDSSLFTVLASDFTKTGFGNMPKAIFNSFVYAGFQCVTLPTMIACGTTMRSERGCSKAMWISFVMNAVALTLSIFMLMCWQGVYNSVDGGATIPTLTACNAMSIRALTVIYGVCLLLCLISTGVTTIFGFVARFEKLPIFSGIKSTTTRSAIVSAFIIVLSMTISMAGLTNIIKYGYGYCGYLGAAAVVIPFLTVGVYKNCKYIKEHGFATEDAVNTARAAAAVAQAGDPSVAAIASTETSNLYGLEVIERGINKSLLNTTRFAVFSRCENPSRARTNSTFMMLFAVNNEAGALANAINVIARHGFNMTTLRSHPLKDKPWQYYFYVEAEGDESSETGKNMLSELQEHCSQIKIIGHYNMEVPLEDNE